MIHTDKTSQGPWRFFLNPAATGGDRNRRVFLALAVMVFGPVLFLFGVQDWVAGRPAEAVAVFVVVAVLFSSLLVNRIAHDIRWGYRLVALAVLGLMGFALGIGAGHGMSFLWFYFFPVGVFYLFGAREGGIWVVLSLAITGLFMFSGPGHAYAYEVALRFSLTYLIVGVLALGLELGRLGLEERLELEKTQLEEALSKVRTLSGLVPICASCKSIRNDEGFWTKIEQYLAERSEAEFSHGLCPPCQKRLFPGYQPEGPDPSAPAGPSDDSLE